MSTGCVNYQEATSKGHDLDDSKENHADGPAAPAAGERSGVFIIDLDRRIRLITPVAESLLGWSNENANGMYCSVIFDCRDAHDCSLCDRCPSVRAFDGQQVTEQVAISMLNKYGSRRPMNLHFWYLPPAGRVREARLMGVFQSTNP